MIIGSTAYIVLLLIQIKVWMWQPIIPTRLLGRHVRKKRGELKGSIPQGYQAIIGVKKGFPF